MPATKAEALVPGLIVKDADLSADAEALDRLALWALRLYAPVVAADPPDGHRRTPLGVAASIRCLGRWIAFSVSEAQWARRSICAALAARCGGAVAASGETPSRTASTMRFFDTRPK
jgi:hypothetical protein